jgi:hypothetical protein
MKFWIFLQKSAWGCVVPEKSIGGWPLMIDGLLKPFANEFIQV